MLSCNLVNRVSPANILDYFKDDITDAGINAKNKIKVEKMKIISKALLPSRKC